MKRKIVLIQLLLSICISVMAQTQPYCPVRSYTPSWDWTQDIAPPHDFDSYLQTSLHTSQFVDLLSPFYDGNNPNTLPFAFPAEKDHKPEDGWVLVYMGLGTCNNPSGGTCPYSEAVEHPYFILYNKYTAKLRIFVCIMNPNSSGYNSAVIKASFVPITSGSSTWKETALFGATETVMQPLENFTKNISINAVNYYSIQNDFWVYADIPVTYDPCTCTEDELVLRFEVNVVENSNTSVVFNYPNFDINEQVLNGTNVANGLNFKSLISTINGAVSSGNKAYDNTQKVVDEINKFIQKQGTNKKGEMQASLQELINVLKFVPKLGQVIGVFDYFISGGKESVSKDEISPLAATAAQSATGNITTQYNLETPTITIPGSDNLNVGTASLLPEYNNPLGIFNLLEAPVVEFIDYQPDPNSVFINPGTGTPSAPIAAMRQYKVKEDLKYVFNTHSDMQIVDFDVALIFDYPSGMDFESPFITGVPKPVDVNIYSSTSIIPPFKDRLVDIGMEIESWGVSPPNAPTLAGPVRLRTPYLPVGCFPSQSVLLYNQGSQPDMHCKISLKLRRNDYQTSGAQDVTMVVTYPVKLQAADDNGDEANVYFFEGEANEVNESVNFWVTGFSSAGNSTGLNWATLNGYGLPDIVTVNNSFVFGSNQEIKAKKIINILPGTVIPANQNIKFMAGQEINVSANVDIPADVQLLIGFTDGCKTRAVNEQTNSQISTFCNDPNKYNNVAQAKNGPIDVHDNPLIPKKSFDLKLYPNPTSGVVFLDLTSVPGETLRYSIIDVTGKEVISGIISANESGRSRLEIDMASLSSGIYLLNASSPNGYSKVYKVSKQ